MIENNSNASHSQKQPSQLIYVTHPNDKSKCQRLQNKEVSNDTEKSTPTDGLSLFIRFVYKIRLVRSQKWYNMLYLGITILLIICLTLESPDPNNIVSNISKVIQYGCHCLFLLFVVMRLLSFQPIFLGWCGAEFIAFCSGLCTLFAKDEQAYRYLHTASCIRAIILVRTTSLYTPFLNFVNGFKNISKVILPALILIYLYSVVGLFAFSSTQTNICNYQLDLIHTRRFQYEKQSINKCSSDQCPILDLSDFSHFKCISFAEIESIINQEYGRGAFRSRQDGRQLLSYKNILYSFYNTYKMVFVAGWSRVAAIQKENSNQIFVCFYYVSFLYLVAYIYMNIFYGTMIMNEQQNNPELIKPTKLTFMRKQENIIVVADDAQQKKPSLKSRSRKSRISTSLDQIKQIMATINLNPKLKQELLMVVVKQKKQQPGIFQYQQYSQLGLDCLPADKEIAALRKDYYLPENADTKKMMEKIGEVYNKINRFFIFICCLNMLVQTQGLAYRSCSLRGNIDYICTLQVFVNFFLQLSWQHLKQAKLMNWCSGNKVTVPDHLLAFSLELKIQMIIVILTGTGLILEIFYEPTVPYLLYPASKMAKFLRAIKYVRIYKVFNDHALLRTAKIVFQSIIKVIQKIGSYIGFYFLMLHIFSLIGYNLFHHVQNVPYSYSFTSVFKSFIFVFMIFSNEQEDSIIFEQYSIHGIIVILFHIICLTVGVGILSKYFMTLLLTQLLQQLDKRQLISDTPNQSIIQQTQPAQFNQNDNKVCQKNEQDEPKQNFHQLDFCHQQKQLQTHIVSVQSQSILNIFKKRFSLFFQTYYYFAIHFAITLICLIEVANRGPLIDRQSQTFRDFRKLEIVLTIYFLLETVLGLIGLGLFRGDNSYFLKLKSHSLSLIITIICLISLIPFFQQSQLVYKLCKIKVLRMFVTLDLFSMKNYKMKLTVLGFVKLIPKLIAFLNVVVIFWGFFAIVLVAVFQHQFYYCENYVQNIAIESMKDCFNWGGDWVSNPLKTDYSLMAIINIVAISLTEGWTSFMEPITSIRGANLQPVINANYEMHLLSVLFYLAGSFIILNVFVGFSLYQMKKITRNQTGERDLSKFQQKWLCIKQQINLLVLHQKIDMQSSFRRACQIVANSNIYKIFKVLYICAFLIILSLLTSTTSDKHKMQIFKIQLVFIASSLFLLILQLSAKNRKPPLWRLGFNLFFYAYAIVFFVYAFFKNEGNLAGSIMIFGAILVSLQLFQYWLYLIQFQFVKKTLKYLTIILPRALYILVLMFVILLTYTFVALELFPYLKLTGSSNQFREDYTTFFNALFSLVKFSTWESTIQQIIDATNQSRPNSICFIVDTYEQYLQYGAMGCGSTYKAYTFFLTFHIIYSMIMQSALMANIFQSYQQFKRQELVLLNQCQLDKVTQQWQKFDESAIGFLPYHNFWRFTSKLYSIYGLSDCEKLTPEVKSTFLATLNINLYNRNGVLGFQFYQTIQQLTRLLLTRKHRIPFKQNLGDLIYEKINGKKQKTMETTLFTSKDVLSIIVLKRGLREWRKKVKIEQNKQVRKKFHSIMKQKTLTYNFNQKQQIIVDDC